MNQSPQEVVNVSREQIRMMFAFVEYIEKQKVTHEESARLLKTWSKVNRELPEMNYYYRLVVLRGLLLAEHDGKNVIALHIPLQNIAFENVENLLSKLHIEKAHDLKSAPHELTMKVVLDTLLDCYQKAWDGLPCIDYLIGPTTICISPK